MIILFLDLSTAFESVQHVATTTSPPTKKNWPNPNSILERRYTLYYRDGTVSKLT